MIWEVIIGILIGLALIGLAMFIALIILIITLDEGDIYLE